jgi:hypothetical protein
MGIRCCFVEQAAYFLIAADMQAGVFGKGWHGSLRMFKSALCAICAYVVKESWVGFLRQVDN